MIDGEINQLIIDKIEDADASEQVKQFILEILRHERSVYDQYEAGGMPRYSKVYESLIKRYAREASTIDVGSEE